MSQEWDHTCEILAMIANVNRAKGKPPIRAKQIHPFKRRAQGDTAGGSGKQSVKITRDNIHLLKQLVPRHGEIETTSRRSHKTQGQPPPG